MNAFLKNDSPGAVYIKAMVALYFSYGIANLLATVIDEWQRLTFWHLITGAFKVVFFWPSFIPVSLTAFLILSYLILSIFPALLAFDRSLSRDRATKYLNEMAQAKAERDRLAGDCEQKAGELERLRAELADTQQRERLLMFQRDAGGGQPPRYESAAGRVYEAEPEILEPEPRDPIDELYGE